MMPRHSIVMHSMLAFDQRIKYFKLFDVIEIQMLNLENKTITKDAVIKMFLDLIELAETKDIERIISLFFD